MLQKSSPRQITVAEMAPHVHSFGINENKTDKITKWLSSWIQKEIQAGKIKPYDLLPAKGDLAFHIGVSLGTMQNVFRHIEDLGLVESKQRIGTYIKNPNEQKETDKLTSKRELAAEAIKKFILDNNYKPGSCLVSTRKLSEITGISNTTIRMALGSLICEGIIKKENQSFVILTTNFKQEQIQTCTLVEKIAASLKKYIGKNCSTGDKLPVNTELAKMFNVSVKTIHDAVKLLSKDGLVLSRRGQYGTIVINQNEGSSLYSYEKIELKIRHFILENCQIGTKLPSVLDFSKMYDVSAKTIKKALDNLAEDGYLTFARGRYGGTFVTDIPQGINEAYKWLALSPGYVANT